MANAQRVLGPLLLILLIVGVVFATYVSITRQRQEHAAQVAAGAVVTVTGLIGSEKEGYLTDPRVLDVLRRNGIDLKVETVGSREMASRADPKVYDFAFPAGVPGATKIMQATGIKKSVSPFFTPMAIASWKPIADVLLANGIVSKRNNYYYIVDMKRLLDAIVADKRWSELPHNPDYAINKSILISSTDVRKSNSAAMYLALASYIFNNDEIVDNQNQVDAVLPKAANLFLRQGYQEGSSAGPFEDYLAMGMGKAPLVMIYEAQFIEYQSTHKGNRNGDMVLMYPQPTVFTKHIFIPFNAKGEKLGDLLVNDPELQRLAVEHGLRTSNADDARAFWKKNDIHVPDTLINVIDPPSYDILESMIKGIEQKFNS
ncbi:MAG TPA: hypothetical protein VKF82_11430 [Candidatus Eremiobacteraceae bacterium]|nr:hypothetical protein [Candidatus Eremiobacteraceae bacterium]